MPSPNMIPGGAAESPPPSPGISLLFLLAGALLISFSAVMVKLAQVGPATSGFYRVLIGGAALCLVALLRGSRLWAGWPALGGALLAGLLFALDLSFWHRCIIHVGPGVATILSNLQVFALALIGVVFMGERPGWRLAVAIPLAMLGLWLLVGSSWYSHGGDYRLGVVLGLLTACAYTGYLLVLRWSTRLAGGLAIEANMAIISLACALILLAEALRAGESLAVPSAASWGWLALYGLGCHALGWVLISLGLRRVPASQAGLALLLQPTMAFVWDMVLFGRPTTLMEAGGAILALGAIYLGSQSRSANSS